MLAFFLALFSVAGAMAQPALPDIAVKADKGLLILSWTCQYNGIRSITVMRSQDSVKNYTAIGQVKNKGKGIQAFADGHFAVGKNFYKLAIVFSSGLSWTSNHCSVVADRAMLATVHNAWPSNDSLQLYLFAGNSDRPAPADTIAAAISRAGASRVVIAPHKDSIVAAKPVRQPAIRVDTSKQAEPRKIFVAFDADTTNVAPGIVKDSTHSVPVKKKITVAFAYPDSNSATFVRSRFIYADTATGHIKMYLPDDVKNHHYSVKFYDDQGHMIIDLPKINTAKLIIDKRNFQRTGTYKFVIRKDVTELEKGSVVVGP